MDPTVIIHSALKIYEVVKGGRKSAKQYQRLAEKVAIGLVNLSESILQVEKKIDQWLLQGKVPPETFRRWVKQAKQVEQQARQAMQVEKGSPPLDNDTLNDFHFQINCRLEISPFSHRQLSRASLSTTQHIVIIHKGSNGTKHGAEKPVEENDKEQIDMRQDGEPLITTAEPNAKFTTFSDLRDLYKGIAFKSESEIEELETLPTDLSMSWSEMAQQKIPEPQVSSDTSTTELTDERFKPLKLELVEPVPTPSSRLSPAEPEGAVTELPSMSINSTLSVQFSLQTHGAEGMDQEPTPTIGNSSPEAEREHAATQPRLSSLLVDVSLAGDLSSFVDMRFEMLHVFTSSKVQYANDEFKCFEVASEEDHYRILMREKSTSHAVQGGASSSQLPENSSFKLPEHLILEQCGAGLIDVVDQDKWRQAGVIVLRESPCKSLPQHPLCPNLVFLCLQRNRHLREVPASFFGSMPSLRVVDLSGSRMRCLPPSLFEGCNKLQVLILRNCALLNELPKEIERLVALEVLDLSGTNLNEAPNEIGCLFSLRYLQLTFYGADEESEYRYLPHEVFSHAILSSLQSLQALSIVVHPEDGRWIRSAKAVVHDVGKLRCLFFLEFYFPEVDLLTDFTNKSPSWQRIKTNKFKFVVGKNVKRFADRVPNDVEVKFNEHERCLRLVNGRSAPNGVVKEVFKCVTAFYLDHHQSVRSLSELGITTSTEIVFCVVRECPNLEAIITDDGDLVEPVYPRLQHMDIHYLWKLETITRKLPPAGSFFCLKSLGVHTCPMMEYVLHTSILQLLHSLEELVVEDCGSVKEIIRSETYGDQVNDSALPPNLHKIKLHYLPQLLTFWQRPKASSDYLNLKEGFKNHLSVTVYSCPMLDLNILESIANDVKVLSFETVFLVKEDGAGVTQITSGSHNMQTKHDAKKEELSDLDSMEGSSDTVEKQSGWPNVFSWKRYQTKRRIKRKDIRRGS